MDTLTQHILSHLARSATPVEWLWTCVSLFTLSVCVRIWLRFLARKREWLGAGLNGTILKQVNGNIEVALWNIGIQELFSAWGITLLLSLPANPHAPITASGIVNGLVIVTVEMILAIKLTRMERRYRRISAEVREREALGFTGPVPVVGYDAQIAATTDLLDSALRMQEAAQETGAAARQALSILYSEKARAARNAGGSTKKGTADNGNRNMVSEG